MRIIGGRLRGKSLRAGRGRRIRPTSDRVREAVFNILGPRVREAVALDLFAGTGGLGIEALSRGAAEAAFIDVHPESLALIRQNLLACGLADAARVIRWNILHNLNCLKAEGPRFDLVFMDPPYHSRTAARALVGARSAGCLKNGAVIVIEHGAEKGSPETADAEGLPFVRVTDRRKYGKTLVTFLTYMI